MSTGERLSLDPSIAVGNHFLHMEVLLLLTAIAAGLLVGLVYCLVKVRAREPSVFALIGLAVMLLGQITAYVFPFGVGLLLGLAYDSFEQEWYGSAIAGSARASYRLRLFLKNAVVGCVSRCLRSGRFADRPTVNRLRRYAQLSARLPDKTSGVVQEAFDPSS
jgi:XapX domain-containing protein